jgi:glucose-6-phosphate 1-dehydrogenase
MKTKLLIFGITGDLSTRKLLPALEQIMRSGTFDDVSVIGVSRHELHVAELLQSIRDDSSLTKAVTGFTMDMARKEDFERLKDYVALADDEQLLIYLSVPPSATSHIVEYLGQSGMNTSNVKLLLEKPFGIDLGSAHEMIDHVARYFDESQVYRIDHYLAKEMSQNIVAFRRGNALFDHLWDNASIERIEVVASEKIGIEGRADFYEQTGALRDVVQGHLMQLLSLVLMETPQAMEWDDVPRLRFQALQAVMPAASALAVRGQYDSYKTEVGNPDSISETFVSLELQSHHAKWQGVPLILTTGKGLSEKLTEVRIHFRKSHDSQTNCLIFKIQPHEGVEIELSIKKPGYDREFETKKLSFEYPADTLLPDAYEQVIVDAINSRKSLFASSEEVLRSWEILQPIQATWAENGDNLRPYPNGSTAADIMR